MAHRPRQCRLCVPNDHRNNPIPGSRMGTCGRAMAQERFGGALLRTGRRAMSNPPTIQTLEPDTDLAIAFLQVLDAAGRHDLAAGDPHSGAIDEAATFLAPVEWDLVRA